MEAVESITEMSHWYEHVLYHLVFLVHALDRLTLSQFQQWDLRRHHPAEHPAEDQAVAEGNDILYNDQEKQ